MIFLILLNFLSLDIQDAKRPVPPGTVKVSENFYVDRTEVNMFEWTFYETFSRTDKDTALLFASKVGRLYDSGPLINVQDYPMHQLTYEEALAFCQWRTSVVNRDFHSNKDYKVLYRLPTEDEFELIVAFETEAFKKRVDKVKDQVATSVTDSEVAGYYGYGPYRKGGRLPKGMAKKRLYGLFSNAAEMSSEKGIAFGMTNLNFDPNGDPLIQTTYDGPSKWVGFRCVAEYVKK